MPFDGSTTIIPGRGTVWRAPAYTPPFDPYTVDPYDPGTFDGWDLIGHTSRKNLASVTKEGGDWENKGSWWTENLERVLKEQVQWGFKVASIQLDLPTFELAFPSGNVTPMGGYATGSDPGSVNTAIMIIGFSGLKRMGVYGPNVSMGLDEAPEFDVEEYFEISIAGSSLETDRPVGPQGGPYELKQGQTIAMYPPKKLVP